MERSAVTLGKDRISIFPKLSYGDHGFTLVLLNYSGLIFAIGGRSLTWGGWSPELLDEELAAWPPATRIALRDKYFAQASDRIGVTATNDFIFGPLHTALRKQLRAGLLAAGNGTGFTFADLLEHPAPSARLPNSRPRKPSCVTTHLRNWDSSCANCARSAAATLDT